MSTEVHPGDAVVAVVALAAGRPVALAELVDESRVVDQRAGHLHEFESGAEGAFDSFAADEPADVDERALQCFAEFFGIFEEVALAEGELLDHEGPAPADEVAEPEGRVVTHGVEGISPRMTAIGALETNPPERTIPSTPNDSMTFAISMLSGI